MNQELNDQLDYRKFYNLEAYLLDDVSKRFRNTGTLSAFDFYCILIWKANRAKNKQVDRLLRKSGSHSFEQTVLRLVDTLVQSQDPKDKLRVLIRDWGFRLPTASAILTILYPSEFTVYDVRVCDTLEKFHELKDRRFTDRLWNEYLKFKHEVEQQAPREFSLREKDRYLWGKSFFMQVSKEIT